MSHESTPQVPAGFLEQVDAEQHAAEQTLARAGRPRRNRILREPVNAWSTGQLAHVIGMSAWFVSREIQAGELKASRFGTEYRIHVDEVRRYLVAKQWPLPHWMRESAVSVESSADTRP
jgi:excisionase family DNA binding protein